MINKILRLLGFDSKHPIFDNSDGYSESIKYKIGVIFATILKLLSFNKEIVSRYKDAVASEVETRAYRFTTYTKYLWLKSLDS